MVHFYRYEWLLSLRAISQKPLNFFLNLREKFLNGNFSNTTFGTDADSNQGPDFVYDESDYRALFNLVTLDVRFLWSYSR